MTKFEIVPVQVQEADVLPGDAPPEPGQWYWLTTEDDGEQFVCVTHAGSNYVEVRGVRDATWRVHLDKAPEEMRYEPNPSAVLEGHVKRQQEKVKALMDRVQQVTAQLGIVQAGVLPAYNEAHALATVSGGGADFAEYGKALEKAKKDTLPDLFKQIEQENDLMVAWMKAQVLPYRSKAEKMRGLIERIDARIFNVELYAGLRETIVQIADGDPAALEAKVHLMQRRHYMDEEALLNYEVGGMDWSSIDKFDEWLCRPENRDRLLPFPRCILSMKVRRWPKERETYGSFARLFEIMWERSADEMVFLYIRNGQQMYRMATALDFGGTLFPNFDHDILRGRMWGKSFCGKWEIVSDDQFHGLCEAYDEAKRKRKIAERTHGLEMKAWKKRKAEGGDKFKEPAPYLSSWWGVKDPRDEYEPFDPSSVYYDDIKRKIDGDIQYHNRVVLILQGLLDRSPVLQPHPPWKLWTDEGMKMGVELVFDQSMAMAQGDPPDFEAYRVQCNKSISFGSVTVGQQDVWEEEQAHIHNAERGCHYPVKRHQPYGNPGPGVVARVTGLSRDKTKAVYTWEKKPHGWKRTNPVVVTGKIDISRVLNADAYVPGDWKRFFHDPRTREKYLEWAPLLLEAEEYHAGNREIAPPPERRPKPPPDPENQEKYRRQKLLKSLRDQVVRLTRDLLLKSGKVYPKGTLFLVGDTSRGLTIHRVDADGRPVKGEWVSNVPTYYVELAK